MRILLPRPAGGSKRWRLRRILLSLRPAAASGHRREVRGDAAFGESRRAEQREVMLKG